MNPNTVNLNAVTLRIGWRNWLPIALSAALGGWLVLRATSLYGVALSPDAAGYLSVARSLLAGAGFTTYEHLPLVDQPPLYSMLLAAVAALFRVDALSVARCVNALIFAATVAGAGLLLTWRVRWAPLRWVGMLWIACAPVFHAIAWGLLTEGLFLLLLILVFLLVEWYQRSPSRWLLAALGAVVALATLTRYLGVTLVATVAILLLIERENAWSRKLANVALFVLVACAPLGVWLARNWTLTGSLMGTRAATRFTLAQNLRLVAITLGNWLLPLERVRELPAELLGASQIPLASYRAATEPHFRFRSPFVPYTLFVLCYLGVVLFSASTVAFDQVGDRLLVPLFIPLVILLFMAQDLLCERLRAGQIKWLAWVVLALVTALVLLSASTTWVASNKAAVDGAGGYHRRAWIESESIGAIQAGALAPALPIESNAHDALYLLLGVDATLSPRRSANNALADERSVEELRGVWPPAEEIWLVWLNRQQRDYLFTPEELATIATITEVATFPDGTIYKVAR